MLPPPPAPAPPPLPLPLQEERSQRANRERAMALLRAKLFEIELEKQRSEVAARRRSQARTRALPRGPPPLRLARVRCCVCRKCPRLRCAQLSVPATAAGGHRQSQRKDQDVQLQGQPHERWVCTLVSACGGRGGRLGGLGPCIVAPACRMSRRAGLPRRPPHQAEPRPEQGAARTACSGGACPPPLGALPVSGLRVLGGCRFLPKPWTSPCPPPPTWPTGQVLEGGLEESIQTMVLMDQQEQLRELAESRPSS